MSFPAFLANDPRKDFWGSNRPPQEKTSSLVITDIPPAHLSVPAVREYFAQFGEVTNVAIETSSKRALITFSNNREAYHAWKSDEAVFGSRHVKVLWHRPRPGQGAKGQQALEASAGLVANLKKIESGEAGEVQGERNVKLSGPDSRLRDTLAELEARERRTKKETLIAEQKVLLNKAKASDKEEKLRILTRLKEIGKEVEALDNPPPNPAGGKDGDVEMSDKDKLDAELEKHGMESAKGRDQEELLKLNAQLTALRDKASKPSTVSFIIPRKYFAHSCQASTLGIPSPTSRYSPYPGARGSRGRGRARGARGGRGGFSRPMSLDNRSRVVAISGEALRTGEGQNTVREWYENTGGHVEVGEMGLLVRYPNREMAERVSGIPLQKTMVLVMNRC
jgi:RNA-binding protein 26